ncbi:SpoIIIAH-like family protein [Flavonifractor sp. DFI.6.63]|uniref:SpoIIIAH-like family protein n=1 Tax=Lawsonibacter hominis TaxID=2763053 RepID=A0A8J6MEB7_9FIRM|nr:MULTISPECIES: SpoIIIAH-like family protein [Oscillospiraceae]MBS1383511.1 SpoIIIAH-like family protein [Flavonifractor sp.]MDU2195209.1 SpoIIIAH-like family protein [Clostridiales bacterium]MDY2977424.1 SpoIIIAH-like family protein [Oscillospiraceae bacterium]MBC5732678.1 SpoIIIAH-like family protein [Lawsonibacter hominis]MCI6399855.1 SpoIIIAH-like family protein [Lawsonibacter sp.]
MKVWKRNAVVAAIVLFVCVAVYLNWSYQKEGGDAAETGKTLGEAALVSGQTADPLLGGTQTAQPGASGSPSPTGAAQASGSDYFASARLNRQQARDSALAILQDALANEDLDETMRADNSQAIQTLASATVSEAQIENLVTAKGYSDCVAFISDESVSVVVSATESGLTDADVAKITEIVTDETGCAASQVKIIEAS